MTISKKCKKIKLLITDVDGVLTDGGMYYSEKGEVLKKFNTKDGMGVEILRNHGIKTVFLTKENSKIARLRGKKVNVDGVYVNIVFKEKELLKICKKFNVTPDEIAYIGDDINDIKIISKVGLSACPNDAVKDVKNGLECGISFKNFVDFKERDIIESYRVDVIERGIND